MNLQNIAELLLERYCLAPASAKNRKERNFAEELFHVIEERIEWDQEEELVVEQNPCADGDEYESEEDAEVIAKANKSQTWEEYEPPSEKSPRQSIPDEQMEQALDFYRSAVKGSRPLSTIQHKYRWIKTESDLKKLREFEKGKGKRLKQLKEIREKLYSTFIAKREYLLPVHDRDLKRWAVQMNRELKPPVSNFKASKWWLHQFKKDFHIVGRKINRFVSKGHARDADKIRFAADKFAMKVKPLIVSYSPSHSYNSDQSGFQKELHSGRTLSNKGEKLVESVVQSVSATTHSYTIQPTISASGELLSPLFICLQEPGGVFPKNKQIFQAPNISVVAHTSHILTKPLMLMWFKEVFFPNVPNNSLLLIDSWNTYKDSDAINSVKPTGKDVNIQTIPRKATGLIQPLDRFFFRMWKDFVRKISDRILLDDLDVNINKRDNILKLQSLTHNQFSAPRFKEFICYAWFKCGYLEACPAAVLHPVQYCFNLNMPDCCNSCVKECFIHCAHCGSYLCFDHFFIENHYCGAE